MLLVDGDSGEILATARQLRGPKLSAFIKQQLEKKFDVTLEDPAESEAKDVQRPQVLKAEIDSDID